jgi:UDP-2,3-diacylglucosamine pyrophosphatase LpxH
MRTLILSDLHLGNSGDYDIFAGNEDLPPLLDRFVEQPTRIILNGDSMDFLMNVAPLKLDVGQAIEQAKAIATAPSTAPTLEALGRICAAGGEVLVRMGNHDVELALAEVRDVFRNHLNQPEAIAKKMIFQRGNEPLLLRIGDINILITHGEQRDPFNQVDYEHLPGPDAPESASAEDFDYPPGSLLVKEILNPLKKKHNMRFADLLKPDFQGAVLTALAVDPYAVKVALKGEALEIVSGALENLGDVTFDPSTDEIGLAYRFQDAGLTQDEVDVLKRQLRVEPEEIDFGLVSDLLYGLRLKLTRAGLKLYARMHRQVVDDSSERYFNFEPRETEMREAQRLADKYGASVVITGHSHAARWKQKDNLLYVNTGTWIWLMRMPDEHASDDEWMEFLKDIKKDPNLEGEKNQAKLEKRFTPVTLEPRTDGGVTVTLHSWEPSRELSTLYEGSVIP